MADLNLDLNSCTEIEPLSDLYVTEDDGEIVRIFSLRKKYKVEKYLDDLRVTDDTGTVNHMGEEYLTANFVLHRSVQR